MVIYKITNKLDGKLYIGQTTQALTERWWQHCNRSPSQTHRSYIYNAIQKDGIENFTIEEIAKATDLDALNLLEEHYIKALNTLAPNGYNLHQGGRGKVCHKDTKAKISETMKTKPKDTLFGGKRQVGAPKGRPVSEERKAQISSTMTGQPQPWKYKPVLAVETGILYESVNAAAKALSINRVTISALLKSGKQGRLGLTFRLITNKV